MRGALRRRNGAIMPTFDDVVKRVRIELDDAKDKLEIWREEARVKGSLAKLEVKQAIDRVYTAAVTVENKIDDAEKDAGRTWDHLKHGVEHAWQELKHAVTEARKHFP